MHDLLAIVILFTLILVSNATLRPRGVPLSNAALYQPLEDKTWLCLDGSRTIAYLNINDDYCDCADGSDEPGTAACLNGRFHCLNDGHKAQDIPSSRVNDGVCDCCDGTDEYDSDKCKNTCQELGQADLLKHKNEIELHKRGAEKKIEMISRGKQLKAERETRLVELRQQLKEQLDLKIEKEHLKEQVELLESEALEIFRKQHSNNTDTSLNSEDDPEYLRNEASICFAEIDTNKDGFIELTELMVDMTFDRDRNGVVTIEEAKFFLDERDRIDLDNFLTLAWPRIKPLKMLAEGVFKPPIKDVFDDASDVIPEKIEAENAELDTNDKDLEDVEPDSDLAEDDQYDDEEPDVGVGESTPESPPLPEYDVETQRFIEQANEVRNSFSELERVVREIEHEIKELEEQNTKDFGVNEEYALLDGECFKLEDREYVYTLCPFDRASQKQRSGGAETTLGRWEGWVEASENKYSKQKYSNGASCWNGPQRSTLVEIQCALESKITSVSEPNRCEYHFQFETPAACKSELFANSDANLHDEL